MELDIKEYGNDGSHVLILHGLLGSNVNWHQIARQLSSAYTVIVPSLRNHGNSPHGPHSILLMCDDIIELLKKRNIATVHLIGHSMGGMAAMKFAAMYPNNLKSLTVVDVAPASKLGGMDVIFEALLSVNLQLVTRKEDANQQLAENIKNPGVRQFLLQNLKRQSDGSYHWQCNLAELHRFTQNNPNFSLADNEHWRGPVLFIGGELSEHRIQDHMKKISHHFPDARLKMIPGAGHWVHFDAPRAFLARVTEFLRAHSQ